MSTSAEMKDLTVKHVYTTDDQASSSFGAMTLTCGKNGHTIHVRTIPFYEDGQLVTGDRFLGKTIDVKGVVDFFDGQYQLKVFTIDNITIHN